MIRRHLIPFLAVIAPLAAEPLPQERMVDFIVVPVGPVALAQFENVESTAAPATQDGREASPPARPGGGGVRVKEVDPSEAPPNAVYLKKGSSHYQIPCFLNAVGMPVRMPVTDTELAFLTKSGNGDFVNLEKCLLPTDTSCVLVLLTKPLGGKKWTNPKVTLIPVPRDQETRVLVANASMAASCGAVFNSEMKILLPPLKHHLWKPAAGRSEGFSEVALAMADEGGFHPAFFNDRLSFVNGSTSVLIGYDVTPQESFRCGKYLMGVIRDGEFRPAIADSAPIR
jgi:hypothetical protein